jgi:hypothetical protein
VGLVYDPRELLGVTTARPGVDGVLQYKNMTAKSKIAVKKNTTENTTVVSTYLGRTMLRFQRQSLYHGPI